MKVYINWDDEGLVLEIDKPAADFLFSILSILPEVVKMRQGESEVAKSENS